MILKKILEFYMKKKIQGEMQIYLLKNTLKKIENIEIKNPFQLPEIKALKSSILDIRVTDERHISYIVEMQVEELDGFDKRVQYYTARQYSSQIEKGEDYPKLNQVIFIGILDFIFFEDDRAVLE